MAGGGARCSPKRVRTEAGLEQQVGVRENDLARLSTALVAQVYARIADHDAVLGQQPVDCLAVASRIRRIDDEARDRHPAAIEQRHRQFGRVDAQAGEAGLKRRNAGP